MATDSLVRSDHPPMSVPELVAFTKKELDADAEHQAKLQAGGAEEVPRESHAGATLNLSDKNIHALPVEVIGLIKDKVERLALSHNPQISIPSQIVQCDRIRYLNIQWNQLTQFPGAILQLSKLEILDLRRNRIIAIPEDINRLSSLKYLAVGHNRITKLPLAIGRMSSLSKLNFDEDSLEFPSAETLKQYEESTAPSLDAERTQDMCQIVKGYLRAVANKDRPQAAVEEELSESSVETPRPPKRTATAGRFPIKASIGGIENAVDPRSGSPPEHIAPPIPQRSHARGASATATNSLQMKRPGIAPLFLNGNDTSRSRSETAPPSASLREKRRGFVPIRNRPGDLNSVSETPSQDADRSSAASTIKPSHSRGMSSISTTNSFLAASSGDTSSDAISPMDGPGVRYDSVTSVPKSMQGNGGAGSNKAIKGTKRLLFALSQLEEPITSIAIAIKEGTPKRSHLERQAFTAKAQGKELDRVLRRLQNSMDDGSSRNFDTIKDIIHASIQALRFYGAVTGELKRNVPGIAKSVDGIYIRSLMFQMYGTMVEARNICTLLGLKIKERATRKETPLISEAWSSKSVTPTQAKVPCRLRSRRATPLHNMASSAALRAMPPPPVPLNANVSRADTLNSMRAATPRSDDSFSTLALARDSNVSRPNTMRSAIDIVENDDQFDRIFIKLKSACDLAAHALPHCRVEFNTRRDSASSIGQRTLANHWTMALKKCDIIINHNKTLKKRLEIVKVNDPGVRYQRDFWQLCDTFVHSWADLATEVKDIGSQRVDITTVKQIMRNVQRAVRDVSKTISNSPLYHHALGTKGPDSAGPHSLAPPFPGLNTPYIGPTSAISTQSSYVTAGPATPLSAALGPAAHSSIVPTPSTAERPSEYFARHTSTRSTHERTERIERGESGLQRNDTVMQPPRQHRRP